MSTPLLIRDVMRLGAPTCKLADALDKIAALMLDQAATALIVLDEDADTRGRISEENHAPNLTGLILPSAPIRYDMVASRC